MDVFTGCFLTCLWLTLYASIVDYMVEMRSTRVSLTNLLLLTTYSSVTKHV